LGGREGGREGGKEGVSNDPHDLADAGKVQIVKKEGRKETTKGKRREKGGRERGREGKRVGIGDRERT
jgi:hypothetical protein